MADRDELRALAQRVMGLARPDREVDASISFAVYHNLTRAAGCMLYEPEIGAGLRPLPAFTASLDTAMTLVPEGCQSLWALPPIGGPTKWAVHLTYNDCMSEYSGHGSSFPLALTAAALLALAEQVPE